MKRKQPESRHRWGAFAVCMRVHLHNTQELFTAHLRSSPLPFTVRVSDRSSSWWVSAAAYAFRKSTVVKSASDIVARGREPSCCLPYTMAFPSAGKRRGCRMARQNAAGGTCWWGGLQLKFPEWNHTEQNSSGVSRSRNHFTHDHSRVTLGLMTCPVRPAPAHSICAPRPSPSWQWDSAAKEPAAQAATRIAVGRSHPPRSPGWGRPPVPPRSDDDGVLTASCGLGLSVPSCSRAALQPLPLLWAQWAGRCSAAPELHFVVSGGGRAALALWLHPVFFAFASSVINASSWQGSWHQPYHAGFSSLITPLDCVF